MSKSVEEFESWWRELFGEECDCSKFDSTAMKLLNEIRVMNVSGDQDIRERLVPHLKHQEKCYRDRNAKLQKMETAAIPRKISSLIHEDVALKTLSTIAGELSTDSTNQRQLVTAIASLKLKNVMDNSIEYKTKSVGELMHLNQRANRLEKDNALDNWSNKAESKPDIGLTKFLIAKSGKYCSEIKRIEDDLASRKDESITVETLTEKYKLLCDLKSKLKSANEQLGGYCSLPPDQYHARLKTAEAYHKLMQLESQIQKKIGDRL